MYFSWGKLILSFELCFLNQPSQHQRNLSREGEKKQDEGNKNTEEELDREVCLSTQIQRCLTEEELLAEGRKGYWEHPVLQP